MKISPVSFKGVPPNYAVVNRYLSRSAQPMADDFLWLSEHGVTDIINFRTMYYSGLNFDEQQLVKQLGMNYHNIPSYTSKPAEENVINFLDIISKVRTANGKVHMHCMAGADRTGMYAYIFKCLNNIGTPIINEEEWLKMGHDTKRYPDLISETKTLVKKLMKI